MEETTRERAVIAAVETGQYDIEVSLSEMRALCDTAGADVVGEVVQRRSSPDPATFFGKGKLEEAKALCESLDADLFIVDAELSAGVLRNLEEILSVDIIDRTALILDIFARSAKTAEGMLQVELAQLSYRLPRLIKAGKALSRLGGGIGTRGPGESKLESDRRYIRTRIAILKERLMEMEKRRDISRLSREKNRIPVISLVGYTNVGKSSLLNALTGSDVLAQDKLFATLDPTVRRLDIGDLNNVVLVDTVGFVSRLPHHLIDAFKSTLEEIKYSRLILKIADASNPLWEEQLHVTDSVLTDLGCSGIPSLLVFNKSDLGHAVTRSNAVHVSAKTGLGLDKLKDNISGILSEGVLSSTFLFPFNKLADAGVLRGHGNIIEQEYTENGLLVKAELPRELYQKFKPYEVKLQMLEK